MQTPYFHKLNWIHKQSRDTVTKYDGYVLSVSKSMTLQIPSNTFQCEAACTSDMYTFQSGNVNLHGNYAIGYAKNIINMSDHVRPLCSQCPV